MYSWFVAYYEQVVISADSGLPTHPDADLLVWLRNGRDNVTAGLRSFCNGFVANRRFDRIEALPDALRLSTLGQTKLTLKAL